jgi:acyl carrier protein
MTNDEILFHLSYLFREIFSDQLPDLGLEMTADDIPGWDSMSQITLAVEIEHCFHIKLRSAEMAELRNIRQLVDLITVRLTIAPSSASTPRSDVPLS